MTKCLLGYILKIILVIALVLAVCISLVELGERKNKKPTVKPDAHGEIILKAINANIIGVGTARYNILKEVENIGWWDHTTQSLMWNFTVKTESPYQVILNYALPPNHKTELIISVLDQKINSVIPATGAWDKWQDISLGQFNLSPGNTYEITITPIKTTGGIGIMNLRDLQLKPITPVK